MLLKNSIKGIFFALLCLRPFISASSYPFEDILYSFSLIIFSLLAFKDAPLTPQTSLGTRSVKLFLCACCFSLAISGFHIVNFIRFIQFCAAGIVFLTVVRMEQKNKITLIVTLLLSATAVSITALFWHLIGSFYTFDALQKNHVQWQFAYEYLSRGRAFTPFILPSSLGGYLILFIPLTAAFLYRTPSAPVWRTKNIDLKNVLGLIAVLSTILTLLATQSLGAILSLGAAVAIFAFTQKDFRTKKTAGIIILCLAAALTGLVLTRSTNTHFFNLPAYSLVHRGKFWKEALDTILHHPLFGVGLGNYPFLKSVTASSSHNAYLDIWAETGIFGIGAFLVFITQTLKICFSETTEPMQSLIKALWIGNCAFLIHNLFDFTLLQPEASLAWWVVAALLCSSREKA